MSSTDLKCQTNTCKPPHNLLSTFKQYDNLESDFGQTMASSGRVQSPAKRLLTELQNYQSDPNEALDRLGPVNDDELTHWNAVMRGVPGTAYEGLLLC
jgi:hypothetical protein